MTEWREDESRRIAATVRRRLWPAYLLALLLNVQAAQAEGGGEGLGSPIQQDGYLLRPPEHFRMGRPELFAGSRTGAISQNPGVHRFLSAALLDGQGEDAASLLIAVIEEPLHLTPSVREEFSIAVVKHFADELGMPLSLDRAERVEGGAPRLEVTGSVSEAGLKRSLLVAAFPGETRHVVVTFSAPSGRYLALLPLLRRSLDTFRLSEVSPTPFWLSQKALGAFAGALAGALLASLFLWRSRRRTSRQSQ